MAEAVAPSAPATSRTPADAASGLSTREAEVLDLIAAGRSNKEIAEALVLSVNTMERHVTHILQKTGASNRTSVLGTARTGATGDCGLSVGPTEC